MKRNRRLSSYFKIIIAVSSFLLLADVLFGVVFTIRSVDRMKRVIQSKITEVAGTAANLLNGDEIYSLTQEDKDNETEAYTRNYDILAAFKTSSIDANAELAYIYCLVHKDGKYVFSIDPSDDPAVFLVEETIDTYAMERAFEGVAGFDDDSYVDRWGDLYTAYAPVFGSDGTVKAVVGVDVWASWYKQEIYSNIGLIAIVTGATLLLGLGVTIVILMQVQKKVNNVTREMSTLNDDIDNLLNEFKLAPEHDASQIVLDDDNNDKNTLTMLRKEIALGRINLDRYLNYSHQQSLTDKLTLLGNRNAYYEQVKKIEKSIDNNERVFFVVALFEINGLKELDDEYGYDLGDKVILETASIISETFTKERSFRIGGGVFAVIYQNMNEEALENRIKDFREILDDKNNSGELPIQISISQGYAMFNPKEDKKFSGPFSRAAEAMDKEKAKYQSALRKAKK